MKTKIPVSWYLFVAALLAGAATAWSDAGVKWVSTVLAIAAGLCFIGAIITEGPIGGSE